MFLPTYLRRQQIVKHLRRHFGRLFSGSLRRTSRLKRAPRWAMDEYLTGQLLRCVWKLFQALGAFWKAVVAAAAAALGICRLRFRGSLLKCDKLFVAFETSVELATPRSQLPL